MTTSLTVDLARAREVRIEAAAKTLAEILNMSWDGLTEGRISDRDFPQWATNGIGHRHYQGGKQDLRDWVEKIDSLLAFSSREKPVAGWIACSADRSRRGIMFEKPDSAEWDGVVEPLYRHPSPDRDAVVEEATTTDWPAQAVIEGANIVIRVPINALPIAWDAMPSAPRNDEADNLYRITDAALFAKGLCGRLNYEEEDGTTPIHRMLDTTMMEVLEQGDEGIEEVAALKSASPAGEGTP